MILVTHIELRLVLGIEIIWLELYDLLKLLELCSSLVYTTLSRALSSLLNSLWAWLRLGPGNYQVFGFLQRAFLQAWAFELGRVPVPALLVPEYLAGTSTMLT